MLEGGKNGFSSFRLFRLVIDPFDECILKVISDGKKSFSHSTSRLHLENIADKVYFRKGKYLEKSVKDQCSDMHYPRS